MPSDRLVRSFRVFWWTLGVGVLVMSLQTVIAATAGRVHPDPHAVVIGGIEAISAVLFLIPRTMKIGSVGLLVTIALAFALHSATHRFRWDLLIYAAGVYFVYVHGAPRARRHTAAA